MIFPEIQKEFINRSGFRTSDGVLKPLRKESIANCQPGFKKGSN
jgi:hypothetical protein